MITITRNDTQNKNEIWYDAQYAYITARDDNGKVVCHCTYQIEQDILYLFELETIESERQKGFASRVLAYLQDYALTYGVKGKVCRCLVMPQCLIAAEVLLGRFGFSLPVISEEIITFSVSELKKVALAHQDLVSMKGITLHNVLPENVSDLISRIEGLGQKRDLTQSIHSRLSYQYHDGERFAFILISTEENHIVLEGLYVDPDLDRRIAILLLHEGIKAVMERFDENAIVSMSLMNPKIKALAQKVLKEIDYRTMYLIDSVCM